jgi:hypothetical protein
MAFSAHIGEDAADAVLGGGLLGRGLVDIAQGDNLAAALAEAGHVVVRHAAGADDTDFDAHEWG